MNHQDEHDPIQAGDIVLLKVFYRPEPPLYSLLHALSADCDEAVYRRWQGFSCGIVARMSEDGQHAWVYPYDPVHMLLLLPERDIAPVLIERPISDIKRYRSV